MQGEMNHNIRQVIHSKHDVLTFGKFKGKTIEIALLNDPGYILWLYENEVVELPEDIVIEAENIEEEKM